MIVTILTDELTEEQSQKMAKMVTKNPTRFLATYIATAELETRSTMIMNLVETIIYHEELTIALVKHGKEG